MSPKVRLLASLIGGIVLGAVIWLYLDHTEKKMHSRFKMATVMTARRYIAAGKLITPELVEETSVPAAFIQPRAFLGRTELLDKKNKPRYQAGLGLLKGEQLTRSKIRDVESAEGLSWVIPEGNTAQTLRLSLEQAVGGLLQPGDFVDVLWTGRLERGIGRTFCLFQKIRVLAVEDQIWNPDRVGYEKILLKRMQTENILVTLCLAPRDSALLALAKEEGRVSLALTSPLDNTTHEIPPVGGGDLQPG
ncbi:MAG: Flp pilus assembly protein CpaB [Elusimicrobia bacterium]|nr:Flp pilus assembly protein CpaB [Candidatus Obscuribacterium magneticum]